MIDIDDMTSDERDDLIHESESAIAPLAFWFLVCLLICYFWLNVWTIGITLLTLVMLWYHLDNYAKAKYLKDKSDYELITRVIQEQGRESAKLLHTRLLREYERGGGRFAKFAKGKKPTPVNSFKR